MQTGTPLAWTLRAIARLERAGDVRGARLTEPGLARWSRVARKSGLVELIGLLHEDLAGAFPIPFDLSAWAEDPLAGLDGAAAEALIRAAVEEPAGQSGAAFLRAACRAMGLPAGGDPGSLPKIQPHQRAVELPGGGGRIGLRQVTDWGVSLERNLIFVVEGEAERVAVGLAIVECRSNRPAVWTPAELLAAAGRGERFDHVFGLRGHAGAERLAGALAARPGGLEARWA